MRLRLAATLTTTALAAVLLAAPSQAADELDYVALGDSYSAGSGVLPLDPSITPLCARTTRNYPHVIAAATGANLTDMTCGGAQTKDFTAAQYPGVTKPQFDALSADTDLVTLTIGGNDANLFIGAIATCGLAGASTGGFGSPCKTLNGDRFNRDIRETIYPAVRQALQDIAAKAPNASVAILGYPWILPERDGCFLKMPIARGDVPYLREMQTNLNAAVQAGRVGDRCDVRRPERRLRRPRRVPADRHPLGRARAVRHELRAGAPERPRRAEDGRAGDGGARSQLSADGQTSR